MNPLILAVGSPCSCAPGRYVRYVVPAVPGLRATVSCRSHSSTEWRDVRHHAPPAGTMMAVFTPSPGQR